jgi:molybdopterin converting factor small subunit
MKQGIATFIFQSAPGKRKDLPRYEVTAGQSILDALESLRLPLAQPQVPVVNGKTEELAYILQPGDVVTFLPQIAGG